MIDYDFFQENFLRPIFLDLQLIYNANMQFLKLLEQLDFVSTPSIKLSYYFFKIVKKKKIKKKMDSNFFHCF